MKTAIILAATVLAGCAPLAAIEASDPNNTLGFLHNCWRPEHMAGCRSEADLASLRAMAEYWHPRGYGPHPSVYRLAAAPVTAPVPVPRP